MKRFPALLAKASVFLWLLLVWLGPASLQNQLRAAESNSAAAVTIETGPEWVPLRPELEITPGSALDFSKMGLNEAPAGKYGRVIATKDGQFAFEKRSNRPQRFYGVNLCFGAQYLSKGEADILAERLQRLGYNAVRIHHYERDLTQGSQKSYIPNPDKLDQFDYLMAALINRGLYLTTDIYVSRPVPYREIGVDRDGMVPMDTFKILVPVHKGAYENWQAFARQLLGHVNPYTQRSYAQEPGLAFLAMINEGNFGNFFRDIRTIPEWKTAWNDWLGKHYVSREQLASAWGNDLKESEAAKNATVEFPERLQAEGLRARDCIAFLADTEREMVMKMKRFLTDELGCKALVSNSSSWTRFTTDQGAREIYDYVDDHFYVDHPQFLEGNWRLPSRCPNTSPIAEGAAGGRSITFTRLFDKPFTVTEYNYSGPGRFRGVGGILTGAMGSLQGWSGIWRFAYSHSRNAMFTPSQMGYFDVASDPLSQAAERASLCLFLRGDLKTAPHSVALVMTEADLAKPAARIPTLTPKWHWLAWVTRIGTEVRQDPAKGMEHEAILPLGWDTPASAYRSRQVLDMKPYTVDDTQMADTLLQKGVLGDKAIAQPKAKSFRSETGEVTINGPGDQLILDTPRTAGGYALAGQTISAPTGGIQVTMRESDATVWVSALDDKPIRDSRRLLLTHLTDLQNSSIRYAEPERKTLLAWGRLPHLVRAGQAEVSLKLRSPGGYKVWALSQGGKRLGEVPTKTERGNLLFTADVAGDAGSGARILYEIVKD